MPTNFEKLFGPKPLSDVPGPKGKPSGMVPVNVHHVYSPWPFIPTRPGKSILPNKSGEKPA
jgi:hypothetical protein